MAKAKISYLFNGTVHRESFEGYRISITTYSDGRAVVVTYNENDDRVQTLIYRAFERCEINFDVDQVDLAHVDTQVGSDPEVRKNSIACSGSYSLTVDAASSKANPSGLGRDMGSGD